MRQKVLILTSILALGALFYLSQDEQKGSAMTQITVKSASPVVEKKENTSKKPQIDSFTTSLSDLVAEEKKEDNLTLLRKSIKENVSSFKASSGHFKSFQTRQKVVEEALNTPGWLEESIRLSSDPKYASQHYGKDAAAIRFYSIKSLHHVALLGDREPLLKVAHTLVSQHTTEKLLEDQREDLKDVLMGLSDSYSADEIKEKLRSIFTRLNLDYKIAKEFKTILSQSFGDKLLDKFGAEKAHKILISSLKNNQEGL